MGSIIRSTGTVYLNSRQGFNGQKYMYSVIVDSLLGNTKNWESTRSWTAKVRLVHSWADTYIHQKIAIHHRIEFYEPMIKH